MPLEKAQLTNTVTGVKIPVQFNPEEYTLNRDINYAQAAIPGLSAPILQFVNGNLQTLDMELFLDSYEQHKVGSTVVNKAQSDVRVLVKQVTDLMTIEPTTHAPPVLLFTWGSLAFTCVLARVS
ncbi:MAG: peptigoglycan-binding protein LysM, partial [Sulfurifustis sp.]